MPGDKETDSNTVTRRSMFKILVVSSIALLLGAESSAFERDSMRKKKKTAGPKCTKCRVPVYETKCEVIKGKTICKKIEKGCSVLEEVSCPVQLPTSVENVQVIDASR